MTSTECSSYSTSRNNRFQANAYFVPHVTKKWWFWNTATRNWTEWQAAGQDLTGSIQQL